MITVQVHYSSDTGHWRLTYMWTSAHYGMPGSRDASRWSSWLDVDFPVRSRAFPRVWVARDKHANYVTYGACENAPAPIYFGGFNHLEDCHPNGRKVRFPVLEHRNVGSLAVPKPCAISEGPGRQVQGTYWYRPECFFIPDPSGTFRAWYAYQDKQGHPAKDYFTMLTSGNNFETY